MEKKNFDVQFKEFNEDKGYASGWANVYEVGGIKVLDRGGDLVERNAVTGEKRLPILMMHDPERPIGYGYVKEVGKDGRYGLWLDLKLAVNDDTKLGENARFAYSLMKEKIYDSFSIGYSILDYEQVQYKGQRARLLKKLDVHEVSVVFLPMNQHAQMVGSVKQLDAKNIASEYVAAKNEMIADGVSRQSLEDEMAWLMYSKDARPYIEAIMERVGDVTGKKGFPNLTFILKDAPSRYYMKEAVYTMQNPYVQEYLLGLIAKFGQYDSLDTIQ